MKNFIYLVITVIIVVFVSHLIEKAEGGRYNNKRAVSTSQNNSGRDQYGLLASDYDRNGWAKVNGRWVSNPRAGAVVRYSNASLPKTASTVTNTVNNRNSQHANIERTLWRVAENWERNDVNNDGKNNCIDAAILFYQYFPNKNEVRIMLNYNPPEMNHLFNAVLINGVWREIEPQAYSTGHNSYWMRDVWGSSYNRRFNKNATRDYLRYVR